MSGLSDRRIGSAQVNVPILHASAVVGAGALVLLSPPGRAALDTAPLVFAAIALVLLDVLLGGALRGSLRTGLRGGAGVGDRIGRRIGYIPGKAHGAATGLGAVFDPVALAVLPVLWLTGRRRPALLGGGIAVLGIVPTALADGLPGSSWRPLLTDRHLAGDDSDASLRGMLLRIAAERTHGVIGADTPAMTLAWLMLGAAVAVVASLRAARFHTEGQPLLAVAVATAAGLAVLPVAWTYELLWLLPAVVGRVGGRPEDRPVWPVLILVAAAVERDVVDPRLGTSLSAVFGNVPTLVALAAACAVPFRHREDPHWQVHRAAPPPLPPGRRALLPGKARPVTRPNLVLDLMVIRAGYWVYQNIRGDLRTSIPKQREQAVENARHILKIEQFLGIDVEAAVNRWSLKSTRRFELMLDYYRELHYVVPVAVLAWLYIWHPTRYRAARTVLAFTTGLALLGYWLYPLCPPRLFPGSGMISSLPGGPRSYTVAVHLVNPYAAMPSLHFGWALWCAVAVACVVRSPWLKLAAALYPCATFYVIVGTANHWILDAVGAALAVGVAVVAQRALTGRRLRDPVPAFLAKLGTAPVVPRHGSGVPPNTGSGVPAARTVGAVGESDEALTSR